MTKRTALVTAASVFASFVAAGDGVAAPTGVRLSITGDTATTATITWDTAANVAGSVQYGPTNAYGATTQAAAAVNGAFGWTHTAVVTGLSPARTYHYKAGDAADGWSADYTVVTAPAGQCVPFSFVAVGDGRGNVSGAAAEWTNVLAQAAGEGASFILYGGDFVYDGTQASQWNDFLAKSAAQLPLVPLMGALGNHDDGPGQGDGANYNQLFAFPVNGVTNTEDFYSFDWGAVHAVALSTETFNANNYAQQVQWLDADLARTDRIWKVVFLHRPPYSSGNHGSDDGKISPYLTDLFDKHKVDMVVGGHDHDYERFKPMRAGKEAASYADGTLYLVTGGAGAATDPIFPFRPKLPLSAATDNKNHYVLLSVDGAKIHYKAVRVPGGLQGGTGAIEEFDIVKTLSPDPCAAPPDAGTPDAGADSGTTADSGHDSGAPDSGRADAGETDAGEVDAGRFDAGRPEDAGTDAGATAADAAHDSGGQGSDAQSIEDRGEAADGESSADATGTRDTGRETVNDAGTAAADGSGQSQGEAAGCSCSSVGV